MDSNYDTDAAASQLERTALDRFNSPHSDLQLSRVTSLSARYEAVSVRTGWRLAHKDSNEEVVAYFQGVVYRRDLPPFLDKIARNSNRVKHLRQSVTIAGLGTMTFNKVLNVVLDVHALLGRAVGVDNVQECGMISDHHGTQLVELSNRYFTSKSASSSVDDEICFSPDVDPNGYLQSAALSTGLYHSSDNAVEYFEREGTDDNYKYHSAKPVIFSVGDIVEVQCSFAVFPLRGGKFKTSMILRGITLIDGSFTQARIKRGLSAKRITPSNTSLKRKAAYQGEMLSVASEKMVRMEIDERQGKNRRTEGDADDLD